jgi:hypothetical protein
VHILRLISSDKRGEARRMAAGFSVSESVFQPEWSPDGEGIFFVSDRSNWWNLYRFDPASRTSEPLAPTAAEFGVPRGVSVHRLMRAPDQIGSSAPIPQVGSATLQYLI